MNASFKNLHLDSDPFKSREETYERAKYRNFFNTVRTGSGLWPNSIFQEESSYDFNGFEHAISRDDKEDLIFLKNKIFDLGFNLFIRDVSYLNFPAFHVYIPGMSEISNTYSSEGMLRYSYVQRKIFTLFDLKNSSVDDIKELANALDDVYLCDYAHPEWLELTTLLLPHINEELKKISIELLLVMLFYRVEIFEKSYFYINKHIEEISDNERHKYLYFYCVRSYLKFKISNCTNYQERLTPFFGDKVAKMVIDDFANPEKIFNNIKLPSCFNCDICEIQKDCKYFELLKYMKILQNKQKENPINQLELKELFD